MIEKKQPKSLLSPFSYYPALLRHFSLFNEDLEEDLFQKTGTKAGQIGLSEDEGHVYVDVALPGLDQKEIELSLDKGILWVKGENKEAEEEKKKKHYYRLNRSYSYQITVPGDIDEAAEPSATYKNGILHIAFPKAKEAQPKKIAVKQA